MEISEIKTIKGLALFLAQFAGDAVPFNSWKSIPLAEARKSHERAAGGHIQGKIVLTVD